MNGPCGYSQRLCAYADILGFRQLITRLDVAKIERLLLRVHHPAAGAIGLGADFRVDSISDAVAMSASLTKQGFFSLVIALETLTLDLLAEGYFVRGAVVKGPLFHNDQMLFGPALVEAYRLESEVVRFPRIMVHSNVLREAKGWLGKEYRQHIRHADDGPCFLHVLRALETALASSEPLQFPETQFPQIQSMVQKRFRQSIDEPRHFEKVQWFARYWNSIVPPVAKHGLKRIKGGGVEQLPGEWG